MIRRFQVLTVGQSTQVRVRALKCSVRTTSAARKVHVSIVGICEPAASFLVGHVMPFETRHSFELLFMDIGGWRITKLNQSINVGFVHFVSADNAQGLKLLCEDRGAFQRDTGYRKQFCQCATTDPGFASCATGGRSTSDTRGRFSSARI